MDIRAYNRDAWNHQVESGNPWTVPVTPEEISAARQGNWQVLLTPTRFVPRNWFPASLEGIDLLCLACGGGQQGPIFAAAGAKVTVLDNSPMQLAQDSLVARRENLNISTIQGDMADLSVFSDESFDLIFHPVSNIFVPEVIPIWQESYRVLRKGGSLLAGFNNPAMYIFDFDRMDQGEFVVRYPLPYSDLTHLDPERLQHYLDEKNPLEFSHTLEEQIGGQLSAGFMLAAFFEDTDPEMPLSGYMPPFIATRAIKP
jgi:SAM-dependent methyltransferase